MLLKKEFNLVIVDKLIKDSIEKTFQSSEEYYILENMKVQKEIEKNFNGKFKYFLFI